MSARSRSEVGAEASEPESAAGTSEVVLDDATAPAGFTKLPNAILHDPTLAPAAKVVYALLLSYARGRGTCWPAQTTLARQVGCSVGQVRRLLADLRGRGLITATAGGKRGPNTYRIVPISTGEAGPTSQSDSTARASVPMDPVDRAPTRGPSGVDRAPTRAKEDMYDHDESVTSSASLSSSQERATERAPVRALPADSAADLSDDRARVRGLPADAAIDPKDDRAPVRAPVSDRLVRRLEQLGFIDAVELVEEQGAERVAACLRALGRCDPAPDNPGGWLRAVITSGARPRPIRRRGEARRETRRRREGPPPGSMQERFQTMSFEEIREWRRQQGGWAAQPPPPTPDPYTYTPPGLSPEFIEAMKRRRAELSAETTSEKDKGAAPKS